MKDATSLDLGVDVLFIIISAALGVYIWGTLLNVFIELLSLNRPYLWGAGLMLVFNMGHFFWGLFHTDDDLSGIHTRGMMTSYASYQMIWIRVAAFITIGPSKYLREAIRTYRSRSRELDF